MCLVLLWLLENSGNAEAMCCSHYFKEFDNCGAAGMECCCWGLGLLGKCAMLVGAACLGAQMATNILK